MLFSFLFFFYKTNVCLILFFNSRVSVSALISSTSSDLPRISVMTSRGLNQLKLSSSPSSAVMNPLTLILLTFSFSNLPFCAILNCEAVILHRPRKFWRRHGLSRRPVKMGLMSADGLGNRELRLCAVLKVWRLGDSLQNIFYLFVCVPHTILSIPASSLYTCPNITLASLSFLKIIHVQ